MQIVSSEIERDELDREENEDALSWSLEHAREKNEEWS